MLEPTAQSVSIFLIVLNQFDQILKVLLIVHRDPVFLVLVHTIVLHLFIIAEEREGGREGGKGESRGEKKEEREKG